MVNVSAPAIISFTQDRAPALESRWCTNRATLHQHEAYVQLLAAIWIVGAPSDISARRAQ